MWKYARNRFLCSELGSAMQGISSLQCRRHEECSVSVSIASSKVPGEVEKKTAVKAVCAPNMLAKRGPTASSRCLASEYLKQTHSKIKSFRGIISCSARKQTRSPSQTSTCP